jgi:hypothetical protein
MLKKNEIAFNPFNNKDLNSEVNGETNFDATTFKDHSAFKLFEYEDDAFSLNSDRQSPETKSHGLN